MRPTTRPYTCILVIAIVLLASPVVGAVPLVEGHQEAEPRPANVAQPSQVAWNESFGSSGNDKLKAAVSTDDGYVLVGQTDTDSNEADGWLLAVDEAGNSQFEATFGGSGADRFSDVVKTDDGGFLLVGWRHTDDRGKQGWLLKVDEQGNEQWSRTYGASGWDGFWKITPAIDEGYVAAGSSGSDGWALKIDGEGEVQWNRTFATQDSRTEFRSILATEDGYLFAGWTDPANGSESGLAMLANETGFEQWNRSYGEETSRDLIWSTTATDDGFLLAGETIQSGEQPRGWALRVDEDGSVAEQWTDGEPGSRFIDVLSMDDEIVLVGGVNGSNGDFDGQLVGFDQTLQPQWNVTTGGPEWDLHLSGLATDDGYLLSGMTSSYGAEDEDGWIVKLEESTNETDG